MRVPTKTPRPPETLVAAGDRALRWRQYAILQGAGFAAFMVESVPELDARLRDNPETVVLLDEEFTPGIGSFIARLTLANPRVRLVVCTMEPNGATPEEVRRWGAAEAVPRNGEAEVLLDVIRRLGVDLSADDPR